MRAGVFDPTPLANPQRKPRAPEYARFAFEPQTKADFESFCQIAFAEAHADYPLTIVVDELSDVTTIAKAPPAWGKILRRIRK